MDAVNILHCEFSKNSARGYTVGFQRNNAFQITLLGYLTIFVGTCQWFRNRLLIKMPLKLMPIHPCRHNNAPGEDNLARGVAWNTGAARLFVPFT